jgi:hypothetical protein
MIELFVWGGLYDVNNEPIFWSGSTDGYNDFVAYSYSLKLINKHGQLSDPSSGTSYSTPQIAGAIAKIQSFTGNFDRDYAYNLLQTHSVEVRGAGNRPGPDGKTQVLFDGRGAHGYIKYKELAEEFVNINEKIIKHPDVDMTLEVVYSTDKSSNNFIRGFVRYIYVEGTRYSVFKEITL